MAIHVRKEGPAAADNKKGWEIVFEGDLIAMEKNFSNGFERAVRAPGVRLILQNEKGEMVLTKEFRPEQGKHDYRLPGGKVFDDLKSYLAVRNDQDALHLAVMRAGYAEGKQEAGAEKIEDLAMLARSVAGTTIEWDLYYLTGKVQELGAPELSDDEVTDLAGAAFYSKEEVLRMLNLGEISEDRTAGILYRYLAGA